VVGLEVDVSLQHKWRCTGCDCPLRVTFTKVNGDVSLATRVMVGAVSLAVSIHDKPGHEISAYASFCPQCADVGLVEEFMEARSKLIPPSDPRAMRAEGRAAPAAATVPCRACAAMFVWASHRDDHEARQHTDFKALGDSRQMTFQPS
jgi:hypothetical protein